MIEWDDYNSFNDQDPAFGPEVGTPTPPTPTPVITTTTTHEGGRFGRRRHRPLSRRLRIPAPTSHDQPADASHRHARDEQGQVAPSGGATPGESGATYAPAPASVLAELVAAAARAAMASFAGVDSAATGEEPSAIYRPAPLWSPDRVTTIADVLGQVPLPSVWNDDDAIMEAIAIIDALELEEVC